MLQAGVRGDFLASLRRLSDAELIAQLRDHAARERGDTVVLVAHLAELDTRDVHLRHGHGSLFAYCRDVLALSEQEAYNRIAAARATRRFPLILDLLEMGALNLTSVRLLAPRLTPENHEEVLASARGKNKLQVEEIAARLWPRPDAPSYVRKLPAPRTLGNAPAASSAVAGASAAGPSPVGPRPFGPPPSLPVLSARPAAEVSALSPDRYRMQVTIGGDTLEKLRLAKDLLRHAVPTGDEAAILDRALTALLADLAQRKFAAAEKPRASAAPAPGSRHIPAEVKRAVWLRDLGRCAFVGTSGRRCGERGFLEFHHIHPYGLGGQATVGNIQLRCRAHNGYEARVCFGRTSGQGGGGAVREEAARYDPGPVVGSRRRELVLERVEGPDRADGSEPRGASP
jgi:hypothetical protein